MAWVEEGIVEEGIVCIEGDESESDLSDISGSEDDIEGDSDADVNDDTDVDDAVAVAAGLKGNTRLKKVRLQAKAAGRTGAKKQKKGPINRKRGRNPERKKKAPTKKLPKAAHEEGVGTSEIPRLVLGKKARRHFRAEFPVQLADYQGGEPLTTMPECYSSDDLRDFFKLLKAANATN
ncbi:hypothetical protein V5O48_019491, partial [Marasmius crinis-equi]